ncbi:hypothetical protein LSCM1_00506 [Leishmania martiniquensis]|uniref:Uncharacterized protein n=1 Tax=Leishmania martiniquensis TaxID=1580590 RepID=A0A836G1A8_9TRYP|nr:hypothetical protein LSCM1_00506 [Leishmania martiniquensis]
MEASSPAAGTSVDLCVLEYATNMRWLLRYAARELDPTVEQHYPRFVAEVAKLDVILSRTTFERCCKLGDLPFGLVRLSREAVLYLLVSDHLLGGCPPTMHPFLKQAVAPEPKGAVCASPRRAPVSADLNVSFRSDYEGEGKESASLRTLEELDAQPLAAINTSSEEMSMLAEVDAQRSETQAMLLLLRWLFSEGVLSEHEIFETAHLGDIGDGGLNRDAEYERFCRHQQLAYHLAEIMPFYLGAHLLVSRSLLLQYSATLLTAEAVMQHVAHLRSVLPAAATSLSALPTPSSVEGALLDWFQAIVDSINGSDEGAVVMARLQECPALRAFVQCGPFCRDVMDPSDRDFFRLVQSGECVCVVLLFYYPDAFPFAWLSTALRTAEESTREKLNADCELEQLHRYLSLSYWTAIVAATRQLGVWTHLTPEEIVTHGCTALPLHMFCLIQQLFAVLATNAEEDVRVSVDTAWWEQMTSRDGLTEMMTGVVGDASTHTPVWSDPATTKAALRSGSALPGAQRVLRKSMQDTCLPAALASSEVVHNYTRTEHAIMKGVRGERLPETGAVAPTFSPARATASLETDALGSVRIGVDEPVGGDGDADNDDTQFSVKAACAQCDGHVSSRTAGREAFETTLAVLRPMVRWRRSAEAHTGAPSSLAAAMTPPPHRLTNASAGSCEDGLQRTNSRATVFGTHTIDTYTRAEEEGPSGRSATVVGALTTPAALVLSEAFPNSSNTLLHMKTVDSGLRRCSAAGCQEVPTMTTATVSMPVKKGAKTATMVCSERDNTPFTSHLAGGGCTNDRDGFVVASPESVSPSRVWAGGCVVERSSSSSLTHSTDFVPHMRLPAAQDAHEVANEISLSGDLSGANHTSPATTESQHAAEVLSTSPLLTPMTVEAFPAVKLNDSMTLPTATSSASAGLAIASEERFVCRRRDGAAGNANAGADFSAVGWSTDAVSLRLSPSRRPSPTGKSNVEVAAKGSAESAEQAAGTPIPVRVSSVTLLKAPARSASRENYTSKPYPRTPTCLKGTTADRDSISLLREEVKAPLPHATSPARRSSPPSEKSRRSRRQRKSTLRINVVEEHRTVACHALRSQSRERAPAPGEGDERRRMAGEDKGELRASPPRAVSPSPVPPGSQVFSRHAGGGSADEDMTDRTLRNANKSPELSPLTRALAHSLSDTYETVYASLLEDMAASDVDILRRCHRTTMGSSWHSSVSWPHHRSSCGAADSVRSTVSPLQKTAQVRELLDRLTGINLADMVNKDKQELYRALAQQQAVVNDLRSALHGRGGCMGCQERFCHARHRPTLRRRRQLQLPISLAEADDQGSEAVAATKKALSRRAPSLSGDGAGTRDGFISAMTAEVGAAESCVFQRSLPGQATGEDPLS